MNTKYMCIWKLCNSSSRALPNRTYPNQLRLATFVALLAIDAAKKAGGNEAFNGASNYYAMRRGTRNYQSKR